MPNMKKPMPKKPTGKPVPASKKKLMPKIVTKPKPLTGPAAVEAIQRRTSPSGVKKAKSGAKKGIDKKYPGLYKKSK
jgi:hypothetical protein